MACNNSRGGHTLYVWALVYSTDDGGHLIDPATRLIGIFESRELAIEEMREEQEQVDEERGEYGTLDRDQARWDQEDTGDVTTSSRSCGQDVFTITREPVRRR